MSFVNITRGDARGTSFFFWGVRHGSYLNGVSTSALANGTASAMGRARAINEFAVTRPTATAVAKVGDNGTYGTWTQTPTDAMTGTSGFAIFDETFETVAQGRKIYSDNSYRVVADSANCVNYRSLILIANSPATSQETATRGLAGYYVHIYLAVTASPSGESYNINEAVSFPYSLIFDETALDVFGTTLLDADYGTTQAARLRFFSQYPVHGGAYVGDGSASQTIVTSYTPAAASVDAVQVAINGTRRAYTTDYTVDPATKTITFTGTLPAAGQQAVYLYQFLPEC